MNNWNKHMGLCMAACIGLFLISCAEAVDENEEMDYIENERITSLKGMTSLEEDSLSINNIKAFEQRAIQKLEDLKDYFEIMSDFTIDKEFKNQAIVMARKLFAEDENTITFPLYKDQENIAQKTGTFFTLLQNDTYGILSIDIFDISVIKNIKQLNDEEYRGVIKFRLLIKTKQDNLNNNIPMQCEIIAKKVQKKFGIETKQVWEVFLGNIFQVP